MLKKLEFIYQITSLKCKKFEYLDEMLKIK